MPIRKIAPSDVDYFLIAFDEHGVERREPDGTLLSATVLDRAATASDIFMMCHGWQGDVPAAIRQYDLWTAAMFSQGHDLETARVRRHKFNPLVVGVHWPSLPWGDEEIPGGVSGLLSPGDDLEGMVGGCARQTADTPRAREAIRLIVRTALRTARETKPSPELLAAYQTVFAEAGLSGEGTHGAPGMDQDGFDPELIIKEAGELGVQGGAAHLLGSANSWVNVLLMPLRQVSFWKMKDRARQIGETGVHALLMRLQTVASAARVHLMGHSFGCIVVSAAVAAKPLLLRPVDTLFLAQGALSLWSYASEIPYSVGTPGYFSEVLQRGLVSGVILTTRSTYDRAVKLFYPLGAALKRQLLLGEEFPKYGGIGVFGIRGAEKIVDLRMESSEFSYSFNAGQVYNLEASHIIANGGGAAGAHNDIAHSEVAHAFWAAVLSAPSRAEAGQRALRSSQASAQSVPTRSIAGVLGPGERTSEVLEDPDIPPKSHPVDPDRYINAEIEGKSAHDSLAQGEWYTLAFDVDIARRSSAVSTALAEKYIFDANADEVTVTIQVDSEDFDVSDHTRPLRIPRKGASRTKARFDIRAKHNGSSVLKATLHKDGNFIQEIQLTYDVGAPAGASVKIVPRGRPPAAAERLQPRDVGISISPSGGNYECIAWGAVMRRARLPLTTGQLASIADTARREILKVVTYSNASGDYVFQNDIDIPKADSDVALRILARAGATLFNSLFYGPGAADDSRLIGDFLRKTADMPNRRIKLQILAETVPIPWGLLYLGDASVNGVLDWEKFVGMRHIVEQLPLQNSLATVDSKIPSLPELSISLNFNSSIDAQMNSDFVSQQLAYWEQTRISRKLVRVTSRTTTNELLRALAASSNTEQIVYFYCHAAATGLDSPGGVGDSRIFMTDNSVRLGDLQLDAPMTTQLSGNPLVFINACESAELSPAFYDGFVPYFMGKGARGVVGTECKTPAVFAMEWALRFFERFLGGQALGEVFLELRREFWQQHGNPLGLLYAVHCDGDTQVLPAVS